MFRHFGIYILDQFGIYIRLAFGEDTYVFAVTVPFDF